MGEINSVVPWEETFESKHLTIVIHVRGIGCFVSSLDVTIKHLTKAGVRRFVTLFHNMAPTKLYQLPSLYPNGPNSSHKLRTNCFSLSLASCH